MYKKILPLALLLFTGMGVMAQQEKKEKQKTVTIRQKGDTKEKVTVVIDGDNVIVNGTPLDELKDPNLEVYRSENGSLADVFSRFSFPEGGVKMFMDGVSSNKAVLGVTSKKDDKGARVVTVESGSAADKAGLKEDDIITRVNDTRIASSEDLYEAIGNFDPDEKVTITYLRDGREQKATATLGKNKATVRSFNFNSEDLKRGMDSFMPQLREFGGGRGFRELDLFSSNKPRLGITIQDLADGKGVKVTDVDDASAAEKAGLKKDDIITAIDGKEVESVDALKDRIKTLKEGDTLQLTYRRDGQTQTATVAFPKRLKMAEL